MKSVNQLLKEIRRKSEVKKKKDAEIFRFKPDNLVIMTFRIRPDQAEFLEILKSKGFNKQKLIRKALDREFRKKDYREYLDKFKKEF